MVQISAGLIRHVSIKLFLIFRWRRVLGYQPAGKAQLRSWLWVCRGYWSFSLTGEAAAPAASLVLLRRVAASTPAQQYVWQQTALTFYFSFWQSQNPPVFKLSSLHRKPPKRKRQQWNQKQGAIGKNFKMPVISIVSPSHILRFAA